MFVYCVHMMCLCITTNARRRDDHAFSLGKMRSKQTKELHVILCLGMIQCQRGVSVGASVVQDVRGASLSQDVSGAS